MKRSWFGAVLLAALLVLSLLAGRGMDRCQEPVSRGLEEACGLALAGEWPGARESAREAMAHWERCRPFSAVLGNQAAMEEVDSLFARLGICLETESSQTAGLCAELARRVADLRWPANWWDLL